LNAVGPGDFLQILYLTAMYRLLLFVLLLGSCGVAPRLHWPARQSDLGGSAFYRQAAAMGWQSRDSLVTKELLKGNIPAFLQRFRPVKISLTDSLTGKTIRAVFYAAPDYLSLGTNSDWARINITPMAAQKLADSLGCFLPTRKMVDEIYRASTVKLPPVPMYAFRDSTPTMWQHHLIIEGQRKGRKGLIAGIKKDLVISAAVKNDKRPNRVAIYGWHQPDGKPIQPLYTGHVNWWVDYSQGVRLIYRKIKLNGKWMDYTELLHHPRYKQLLCDEEDCDFYRYSY